MRTKFPPARMQETREVLGVLADDAEVAPDFQVFRIRKVYTQSMIRTMLERFAEGQSVAEVCIALGVTKDLFRKWQQEHEEWREAVQVGFLFHEAWWERQARNNLHNKDFNARLYLSVMANKYGWGENITGKLEMVHTERTEQVVEHRLSIEGKAEVLGILLKAGALSLPSEEPRDGVPALTG